MYFSQKHPVSSKLEAAVGPHIVFVVAYLRIHPRKGDKGPELCELYCNCLFVRTGTPVSFLLLLFAAK